MNHGFPHQSRAWAAFCPTEAKGHAAREEDGSCPASLELINVQRFYEKYLGGSQNSWDVYGPGMHADYLHELSCQEFDTDGGRSRS